MASSNILCFWARVVLKLSFHIREMLQMNVFWNQTLGTFHQNDLCLFQSANCPGNQGKARENEKGLKWSGNLRKKGEKSGNYDSLS